VNHSVHVLARGCLTLKLFGSWKTVTTSPSSRLTPFSLPDEPFISPVGEIGIVSKGTGEDGLITL